MSDVKVTETTTRTTVREITLTASEIEKILLEWASQHGFSHRAELQFHIFHESFDEPFVEGLTISETITTTT